MSKIAEWFAKHEDEYLKFHRIKKRRSNRPDLHAFLLLDEIVPLNFGRAEKEEDRHAFDIVSDASHDQIWLDPTEDELSALTEEHVIELRRCGTSWDEGKKSLYMFT